MNQGLRLQFTMTMPALKGSFPLILSSHTYRIGEHIEDGLKQRLKALNLFLKDIYNDQNIINDKIVPAELIASCPHYMAVEVVSIQVPHDIFIHISGIDLIRGDNGVFYVLETIANAFRSFRHAGELWELLSSDYSRNW